MNAQSTGKTAAIDMVAAIHKVEGFDPAAFAVEYTDLNTGERRLRLPVMAQLAWFRLVYPEGKISAVATLAHDHYIGHARVYRNFMDPPECFLAEATASRKYDANKPTVSPREWAQTAAIGIALRNAGFGLQFHAAGDAFDQSAVDELGDLIGSTQVVGETNPHTETEVPFRVPAAESEAQPEEDPLERAMRLTCPLTKEGLRGKTLGELITLDPGALTWIANKYTKDPIIAEAARLICEHALKASA